TPGARSPPRRQDEEPADGEVGGFALDKEFLRSPKGIVMGVELGLCFLVFLLLTASVSAYMGAALLEILVTLTFLGLRATYYHERLTRVNWPCLVFSLILIGIFCLDAYKTYQAEMRSEE
uniref:CKLF like MARVEL transmembrane domain containing 5 n=1 Tax=Pseudonaja textilis TaxID=8673 RepID=A0A670Z001_PSETE